jgi:glutamate-5-semialdehyde dehydrogenase
MFDLKECGEAARKASKSLAKLSTRDKNQYLNAIARHLQTHRQRILDANQVDVENALKEELSPSFVARLKLLDESIEQMLEGIYQVITLPDPVGEMLQTLMRPNGLKIIQRRVPFGVVGIIYESRPNVTVDAASLCLKAGNAVILKGGKEAQWTNRVLVEAIQEAILSEGGDPKSVQWIDDAHRNTTLAMMKMRQYIDVLIPRGGKNLIASVVEHATVPVIETGVGNCHIYVDLDADFTMAQDIIVNAKVQKPSVCNAVETVLIHEGIADVFLPRFVNSMESHLVEMRGCEKTKRICPQVGLATLDDWNQEYLDLKLAVKVVADIDEAISHIQTYGTAHSDAIVTHSQEAAAKFTQEVDSAAVYVNASTRFTDGYAFGLGAEMGISTQKLHARGPMGLKELTTSKYVVQGNGQVRT